MSLQNRGLLQVSTNANIEANLFVQTTSPRQSLDVVILVGVVSNSLIASVLDVGDSHTLGQSQPELKVGCTTDHLVSNIVSHVDVLSHCVHCDKSKTGNK